MKKLVSLAFGTLSLASLIAVSGCKVTFKPIERNYIDETISNPVSEAYENNISSQTPDSDKPHN